MHLAPGTRLGPYEISASIGAGGMGEVYRAHDPRLGRSIAIKILLARHCADPERKLRFAQEARAASALNHPGIVTIYDVGSESGVDFIAMEFVEGKTLDSLIPKGGFPLREILRYATQAADAMAKAHAAGILHRDFKPGNMIITESDQVKILDFGLAKLISKSSEERADETRATGTIAQIGAVTEEGRVMGTAAYMSPEQAEGTTLDSRSDIFSFGAVLYEMTTGQRAFEGGTAMSTIGSVLRDEPRSIRDRRREVPVELERLIRRCLRKDPGKRFQTMADLKVALEELKDESEFRTSRPFPPFKKRVFGLSAGVVVFFCALVLTGLRYGLHPLTPSNVSRPLPLTSYPGDERQPDFSPDGSQVAFVWNGEKQDNWDIYLKVVGSSGMPLRLTNDAASDSRPRWSPDGKAIAFIRSTADEDAIFLTSALGGTERRLAAFPTAIDSGLSWSPDSQWLAVTAGSRNGPTSLRLVSAESGESHTLTTPPPRFGGDFDPAFSPDGRSLAFVREHGMNVQELWILPLTKQGEIQREPKKILGDGKKNQAPAWSADGRDILFSAGELAFGGIFRMRADGSTPPVRVDALGDGVSEPALSWSSHRLAASHFYRTATIWRLDLESRGKQPEQFIASSSFRDAFPQYSPDGARIAFFSNRTGLNQIWTCNSDGTQPVQLTSMSGTTTGTPRWSPDGRWISFDSNSGGTWQIYVVNANGGRPAAVTGGDATNVVAGWSRDGKWIYFTSKRTGAEEVWKTPAPVRNAVPPPDEGTAAVQVTQHGGTSSLESFDGKTLYFTKTTPRFDFSLWKMPVGGGAETEVAPSLHRFNFSLTERSLFYATPSRRGSPAEIRRLDLATGKTVTLYTLTKRIDLGIGVSPDHRYLLFTQLDNVGSDLISVDHFQ